ncbi:hypothetical protein ACFL3J_02845 [Candidatus Omnitrophota bacterium]
MRLTELEQEIYEKFRKEVDGFVGSPDDHVLLSDKVKYKLAAEYDFNIQELNDILSKGYLLEIWNAFGKEEHD